MGGCYPFMIVGLGCCC